MFISGPGMEARMKSLQSTLVRPLRQFLGLPHSAHILSILVECDCPSLSHYRGQLLLSYVRRLQQLRDSGECDDHPAVLRLARSRIIASVWAVSANARSKSDWKETSGRRLLIREVDTLAA